MSSTTAFRGIFTIPPTPFFDDGQVDADSLKRIVDFCVACGAHGLVYPVNASEFFHLSDAERLQMAETLVTHNAGRIPAIIGVSGVTAEVARSFAASARTMGADGVIALPPYLRRHALDMGAVRRYYQDISDAARVPVFIQNYPAPLGMDMSPAFLLELCREIEHVEYIKEESAPTTIRLAEIEAGNDGSCKGVFGGAGGRYLLEEHRRGSAGNMPGCHVTDVLVRLWSALEGGDHATALHVYKELAPLFFFEHQLPGTYKEVLRRRGVISNTYARNRTGDYDNAASEYLDEILVALQPLMSWSVD